MYYLEKVYLIFCSCSSLPFSLSVYQLFVLILSTYKTLQKISVIIFRRLLSHQNKLLDT